MLRVHRLGGDELFLRAGGRFSGGVVTKGRLERGWALRRGQCPAAAIHRPRGDGLSLPAGGRCSGVVVIAGRQEASYCGLSGQGEARCLSVPLIADREGWPVRGSQSPPSAGSLAKGRWVVSPCRWSLLGRGGHRAEATTRPLRVQRLGRHGLSLCASGRCSGGVVIEGRPRPSWCGFFGLVETCCLSVPVVASRVGWSLRGGRSPLAAGSPARGRRFACASRWSLLGRNGR